MKKRFLSLFMILFFSVCITNSNMYGDSAGPGDEAILLGFAGIGLWATPKIGMLAGDKTDLGWTVLNLVVSSAALTGEIITWVNNPDGTKEILLTATFFDGIALIASIYRLFKRSDWLKEKKQQSAFNNFDFFASPSSFGITYKLKF